MLSELTWTRPGLGRVLFCCPREHYRAAGINVHLCADDTRLYLWVNLEDPELQDHREDCPRGLQLLRDGSDDHIVTLGDMLE